jgi:prepilin-type processing-associated H-X9-DG protein
MPIDCRCPQCGSQTLVADQYSGQSGPCAQCGKTVTVPGPAGMAPPIMPPPRTSSGGGGIIAIIAAVVIGLFLCGGVLVALLLPAVQAAREAARRANCSNQLKQIGLAMHNYNDVNGAFPPAYVADANGKPMHSWRVLILPYMEQGQIYNRYDQTQAWDSDANRQLLSEMPSTYQCPSAGQGGQNTSYVVVQGKETIFDGATPCKISSITDGTSNTIMIVEAPQANIPWTEPRDLNFDELSMIINSGANSPHSSHPGGVQVLFADGSVRFLRAGIAPEQLRALLTKAGNEAVSGDF